MVRTQIQLTEAQAKALKRAASERGTSMAALIRQAVDDSIADESAAARRRRALAVVGRFRSGYKDISEEHDRHLVDAFSA